MNTPSFTSSCTTKDLENFTEKLWKVFEVIDVAIIGRVKLDSYQLHDFSRTLFGKWKEGRDKNAPPASWAWFEGDFLGCFFPLELRESKVR